MGDADTSRLAFASALIVSAVQACGSGSASTSRPDDGSVDADSAAAVPDAVQPDAADASSGSDGGAAGDSAGSADSDSVASDSATGPASPLCAGKSCGDSCGDGEFPMFCNREGMCVLGPLCP
jgi:hypothetical protein